jgi:hypothetical protein
MERRDFIKAAAVTAGATLAAADGLRAQNATAASPAPATTIKPAVTVGIATAVAPLAGPDLPKVLDDMQQRGGVNAVFPFIYNHNTDRSGIAAAQLRGGNFAIPHMQYYKDTILTYDDMRAPDYGQLDLFATVIPEAQKRGMKVYAWILEDNTRPPIKNWEPLYEVDFHGRRATKHPGGPCSNNPLYRNYLLGLVEDYTRSYAIGGIMWGSERQGGLHNALGAFHGGGRTDPGLATCFCEFCLKKGKDQGIDVERARAGFGELEKYVRAGRAGQRPRDGYFVEYYRLLLNYPELLAWENFWIRSRFDMQGELYRKIKSINPALPVGWHIWQNVSFSPFHRAEMDYKSMAGFSDFLRPVVYSNCAGERIKSFVASVGQNVYGDTPPDEMLQVLYEQLNYQEAPYNKVAAAGLSADYVQRETKRAVDDLAGTPVQVWPGVGIDVPVAAGTNRSTPADVKANVKAAFAGGATGILLSRNYIEMKPENLAAAGAALKEIGVG